MEKENTDVDNFQPCVASRRILLYFASQDGEHENLDRGPSGILRILSIKAEYDEKPVIPRRVQLPHTGMLLLNSEVVWAKISVTSI